MRVRAEGAAPEQAVTVPRRAFELFLEVLGRMANGNAVTILPVHAELTTRKRRTCSTCRGRGVAARPRVLTSHSGTRRYATARRRVTFVVLYDVCVLYPAQVRDLLLRIATTGVVRARWTDAILDECFRSVVEDRPNLDVEKLARTRALMIRAVPDCLVAGYEHLIEGLDLPDPGDRHALDLAPGAVVQCLTAQAAALRNPPMAVAELLDVLQRARLVQSVARLRELMGPGAVGDWST